MAKKDFSSMNIDRVYGSIADATADADKKERRTYTDKEAAEAMAALKTSGRKGVKLPRINLAFTPDNYDYIKTMSQVRGESLTEFVNHLIALNAQENKEVYEKAKAFKKSL